LFAVSCLAGGSSYFFVFFFCLFFSGFCFFSLLQRLHYGFYFLFSYLSFPFCFFLFFVLLLPLFSLFLCRSSSLCILFFCFKTNRLPLLFFDSLLSKISSLFQFLSNLSLFFKTLYFSSPILKTNTPPGLFLSGGIYKGQGDQDRPYSCPIMTHGE